MVIAMKRQILKVMALFMLLVLCFSVTVTAENDESVVVTVNSNEGYSESGGNFVESNLTGFDGNKSKYAGAITASADFKPDVPEFGSYRVLVYNISNSNAATQAEVVVKHNAGEYIVQYNQVSTPTGWVDIGVFEFNKGSEGCVTIRNSKSETLRLYGIKLEKVEVDNTEIFQDISEVTGKNEINFLAQLGIIADISGKSFRPNDNITRGEWAIWMSKAAGLTEKTDGREIFYDVPKTHRAYGAIAALYDAGLVSGVSGNSFMPDRPITELEGVTILLKVMGYDKMADLEPYPKGYQQCASQLGLGNCPQIPLSRERAANIFYKALMSPVYEIVSGGAYVKYGQSEETMLEKNFDLEAVEGIVTDNGISTMYGRSEIGKNSIAINNEVFDFDDTVKYDYLGVSVRAYVSSDNDAEIKYIFPQKKVSSINIPIEDLSSIKSNTIEYYNEKGTKKKIRFQNSAVIIYNGMAVESFDFNNLLKDETDNGVLTAKDNNDDGIYDVLNITQYKTYVVHRINKNNNQIIVKDLDSNSTVINADSDDLLYISIKENGVKLKSIENLKEWDVISVAQSIDDEGVTVIYKSTDIKNGTITGIDEDNIYIDETAVPKGHSIYDKTGGIRAGKAYSFGLDKDGCIAWIRDVENSTEDFGYLIKYYVGDDGETSTFKILTQNDEIQYYTAASKWTINGKKADNNMAASMFLDDAGTKQQLIRFSLNNEGELKKIETAQDNLSGGVDGSFTLDFRNIKGDEGYFRTGNYKTIAARYVIPSGMLLFVVPQRGLQTTDMYRYYVADDKTLIANTDYDFDGYNINDNEEITIGVVYLAANSGLWARSPMMIIEEINTVWDEEMGAVYEISGFVNNVPTAIKTESTNIAGTYRTPTGEKVHVNELKSGDIIQYSLGKVGILRDNAFKLLFSEEKSGSDENMVSSKDTVRAKSIYGDMYYAYGRVVKTQSNGFVFNTDAGNERIITLMPDTIVLLCEKARGRRYVTESSANEIMAEDNVFVTAVNTNTQMVVIYRD